MHVKGRRDTRSAFHILTGLALALSLAAAAVLYAVEPQPLAEGSRIEEIPGALVIGGGGNLPEDVMRRFVELAGGERARLVVIPTAHASADSPEVEQLVRTWRNWRLASLHVLHTRSRDVADDPAFSEPLTQATGVWFHGGDQNRITAAYLGTRTEERLHDLLRRGGVIGGSSAGAAIMSRTMIVGGASQPRLGRGLGFLPGTLIDQHFLKRRRQPRLLAALSTRPGLVGIGIDEGTALVVQGNQLTVLGDSAVCAFVPDETSAHPPRALTLHAGDSADWPTLRDRTRRLVMTASATAEE